MHLWYFPGGSHLMLGVVGYNASRFLFSIERPGDRVAGALRSIARLAVPVMAFVGVCMLLVGGYSLATLALVNGYVGPASHLDGRWHYWFIEVVVQLLLLTTLLLAIGPVRRLERRFAYGFPLALLGISLVVRELWVNDNLRFQAHGAAWFFVLGWLVHRSTTVPKKLLTTALCLATVPGFFGRPEREWLIAAGLVLLVWCREVALPRVAIRPIAAVAGGQHGDLPDPLPDLAALRPQPSRPRLGLRGDRGVRASRSGSWASAPSASSGSVSAGPSPCRSHRRTRPPGARAARSRLAA